MILVHDVYFSLHDASAEAKAKLVKACLDCLSGYEGCVAMSAGTRSAEFDRPVNDQAFDVALHVSFVDKASHDCLPGASASPAIHRREPPELEAGAGLRLQGGASRGAGVGRLTHV
jgi:hypothetical protein